MLERLNEVNEVKVYSVFDSVFSTYGRVIKGYDFTEIINYMEKNTGFPEVGNVYFPSITEMEICDIYDEVKNTLYGGMPIQIGYCNGMNTTYNGFEYHKGSEINIAVTDFMLVLGHTWEIRDNQFFIGEEKVFYVPKGTAIEMYQTTLHLSPCRVSDEGFKDIVILPRGTNTPLDYKPDSTDPESELLLQKNKWVIAHKDREPLVRQGAHIGLIGINKELKY
ncbi:MAG: DUF4867 family protein [Ruminococcaceae bacterium]|nr:DUF4867 family protein [Oscillospiraceae bacterium]